jgi:hypothetical protein
MQQDLTQIIKTRSSIAKIPAKPALTLTARKKIHPRTRAWWIPAVFAAVAAMGIGAFFLRPSRGERNAGASSAAVIDPVVASATKERPFINSLGMKFVPVPGTNVLFCIHTTRMKDYAAYAAQAPEIDDDWKTQKCDGILISQGDDYPVVGMSWYDAHGFCAWLSRAEGRTYRLPTDHEWSVAVGIGHLEGENASPESKNMMIDKVYPWGTVWPPPPGSGNYADTSYEEKFPKKKFIYGYTDGYPTTSPVMSFAPNKLGLYDMGGNVMQWCDDWYSPAIKQRVLRGRSWDDARPDLLLSSHRHHHSPNFRWYNHGFRVVVVSSSVPAAGN